MIIAKENKTYNNRLFGRGLRKFFHQARFYWISDAIKTLGIQPRSVLELGCYDGKLLDYLPGPVAFYEGFDANWENGLEIAKAKWHNQENYHFRFSEDIGSFTPSRKCYDITIAMETMEHLEEGTIRDYLLRIQQYTGKTFLITLPMETGFPFLVKYMLKHLFFTIDEPYTWRELLHAALGNIKEISRIPYGHKGFNYPEFIHLLNLYFHIQKTEGIPFAFLPVKLNFTVGIICSPREIRS